MRRPHFLQNSQIGAVPSKLSFDKGRVLGLQRMSGKWAAIAASTGMDGRQLWVGRGPDDSSYCPSRAFSQASTPYRNDRPSAADRPMSTSRLLMCVELDRRKRMRTE